VHAARGIAAPVQHGADDVIVGLAAVAWGAEPVIVDVDNVTRGEVLTRDFRDSSVLPRPGAQMIPLVGVFDFQSVPVAIEAPSQALADAMQARWASALADRGWSVPDASRVRVAVYDADPACATEHLGRAYEPTGLGLMQHGCDSSGTARAVRDRLGGGWTAWILAEFVADDSGVCLLAFDITMTPAGLDGRRRGGSLPSRTVCAPGTDEAAFLAAFDAAVTQALAADD
jgi:hypothetical protein